MNTNPRAPLAESDLKTVLIAGAGNIGSGLPTMIGRIPNIGKVLFVDPQVYEEKNLRGQDISRSDVGKPKALVQARRLRRVNPAIDARAFCERIEDLPLGVMQVDSILSCVDSWGVRQYINQGAWHLGVPWIDAAVDASGLLVRVNVYLPGADSICAECGWDDEDYRIAALEQPRPCEIGGGGPAATNAPVSLGLIAAGLIATECQKLLSGDHEHLLAGRQVMLDLRDHTHFVTAFRRTHCRFNHEIWVVEPREASPAAVTLGQALGWAGNGSGSVEGCELRVEGQPFARTQFCPACGNHETIGLCLAHRIPPARRRCPACGGATVVRGFDMREAVGSAGLDREELRRPLSALGVQTGDVVSVSIHGVAGGKHFVLGESTSKRAGDRRQAARPPLSQSVRS